MKLIERWKRESQQMLTSTPETDTKKSADFEIYKTDEDQRLVFGWASVAITVDGQTLEDRQHDMIDPEDLEEAAYEYVLNFRDTGEEHLPGYRKKGKLVESCVFTPEKQKAMGIPEGTLPVGWWIGFKIDDEDTWQRVKNGTYRMFSIEGKAERQQIEKSAYDEWLEENMDKFKSEEEERRFAQWKIPGGGRPRNAGDVDEVDMWWDEYKKKELKKADRTSHTFDEVLKFNPYHGYHGYFSTANGATSMTVRTKDPAKQGWADRGIARAKERTALIQEHEKLMNPENPADFDPAALLMFEAKHPEIVDARLGADPSKLPKKVISEDGTKHVYKAINNEEALAMAEEMGHTPDQLGSKNVSDMRGYIGTGNSFMINNKLRKLDDPDDLSGFDATSYNAIKALDKNMTPSTRDIKVVRMMDEFPSGLMDEKAANDLLQGKMKEIDLDGAVGKVIENKGYSSTSFDFDENAFKGREIRLNINVPKGAPMLISPERSWFDDDQISEAEIILARGTAMKVTEARYVKDGWDEYIVFDCDVLLD